MVTGAVVDDFKAPKSRKAPSKSIFTKEPELSSILSIGISQRLYATVLVSMSL